MSESLFLPCPYVHHYHFSRFHIYVLIYNICFSLSNLLHCVLTGSGFIHLTKINSDLFLFICTATSLSIHLLTDIQAGSMSWLLWSERKWKLLSRAWLCNSMDYSLPGSSVHGILQARKLEWVAVPFSRGSSQPRSQTEVSCIAGSFFTSWVTREALAILNSAAVNHTEVHVSFSIMVFLGLEQFYNLFCYNLSEEGNP